MGAGQLPGCVAAEHSCVGVAVAKGIVLIDSYANKNVDAYKTFTLIPQPYKPATKALRPTPIKGTWGLTTSPLSRR